MNKQRAAQIIEMAFLNADGHILPHELFQYDAQELADALRMAMIALRQNENQHEMTGDRSLASPLSS